MIIGNTNNQGGRFGNKILYINNVVQLANHLNQDFLILDNEVCEHIYINNNIITPINKIDDIIKLNDIILDNINLDNLKNDKNYLLEDGLFELFFKYDNLNTFDIFKLKNNCIIEEGKTIALHFRGTDFFQWDKNCILDYEYYLNSLKYVLSEVDKNFKIFILTDDFTLDSIMKLKEWMDLNNITYNFGKINNPINDFTIMAYSDYLISSPSTFCICSGFMGNPNKKIIHSKSFIENFKLNSNYFRDCFWKILFKTKGNHSYKVYKFI